MILFLTICIFQLEIWKYAFFTTLRYFYLEICKYVDRQPYIEIWKYAIFSFHSDIFI